ncbi:Bug family tripartite tricarboxylate transporter substrate binding protein [Plastoroseomonas hellenica]|uniref:Bug family tripartite tricarboxylate transporter substrate binding protein n=1 Tax=Plastoroseomonas hellenica TaxID=2687306 RepID=UPI001BA63ABA|nr:tripartite tricarboxylate transporter substrate binding protein [Plastoroseomonas hellenica]MBR0643063.1 tripartite tricarboxylate transporter substrate binding protein [Plastoroseomonas hellenica]
MISRRSLPLLALLPLAAPRIARAAFPDRPVTMIVPYAPGGSADVLARVIAPEMARILGQSVVVELRPGAGGNIGAAYVASSARADGYTFLLGSVSLATGPSLTTLNFDPVGGLTPLGGIGAVPNMLVVSPESPFRNLADLLAVARAQPGAISYGSSGLGTGSHLAGELLAAATDTQLLHVPYRGSGAVYPDLIAQRINFLLDAMGSSSGQVRAGSVRALGVTSLQRSDVFPEVPTIAEQGVPGFEFSLWLGFFTRAGTPPDAFTRLEAASRAAIATPLVQQRLQEAAAIAIPTDAAGFARYFTADVERWAKLVAEGKIRRLEA